MGNSEEIHALVIDGTLQGDAHNARYGIFINSDRRWLTFRSFGYLAKLAAARVVGDGWIHKDKIEPGHSQFRYIWRMKKECKVLRVLNDRQGFYQLDVDPVYIHFNHAQLAQFPDVSVQRLFLEGGVGVEWK